VALSAFVDYAPLDGMDEELRQVVTLLASLGGTELAWDLPAEQRTLSAVNARLAVWAGPDRPRNSVLIWMGHGESDGDDAWLTVYDSRRRSANTAINLSNLAYAIRDEWRRRQYDETWSLVVVEACRAAVFATRLNALLAAMHDTPRRLAIIGIGGDRPSYLGEFRQALDKTLATLTVNDATVDVDEMVTRLKRNLHDGAVWPFWLHEAPPLRPRRSIGPVTAPVDVYDELMTFVDALPTDQRTHFLTRAQGAEQGERSWFFVGRRHDRRRIATWLRTATSGMAVVTGRAGAGKSALLGNLVVYANPRLRDLLIRAGELDDLPATDRPPDDVFDAVVHLAGLGIDDVVSRIADVAGLTAPLSRIDASGQVDWLLDRLQADGSAMTLLVDALDEAVGPLTLASSVLRRITALPGIRIVVGTRASTRERPDEPTPADEDLLDALGSAQGMRVFRIEREPSAIADYVIRRLSAARESGAFAADDDSIFDLASRIAEQPGRQFLYARLAVYEILASPDQFITPEGAR
jgi:hypothetical protein